MASSQQALGLRVLITGACFCVVVAGLRAASPILEPVIFSAFLAVLALPPINWLQRKGLPDWLAVTFVFFGVVGAFSVLSILLGDSLSSISDKLPLYEARLEAMTADGLTWLESFGFDLSVDSLVAQIDTGQAARVVQATVASISSILSNTAFVLMTTAFILVEAAGFPRKIRAALGDPEADLDRFSAVLGDIQKYLSIKTWISLLTGGLAWITCAAVGVDYPVLWGVVAFFLNYIPTLGSIIAAVPPTVLALIQYGVKEAVIVLACYVAINMVVGSVIEPKVMGERLGLSGLVVFLSLVCWGWVWGPLGMFLSVPLTMVVKILLENSDDLRWIAVLLGDGSETKARLDTSARAGESPEPAQAKE